MLRLVVQQKLADVSEVLTASIIRTMSSDAISLEQQIRIFSEDDVTTLHAFTT
jgi:hypothetical protein